MEAIPTSHEHSSTKYAGGIICEKGYIKTVVPLLSSMLPDENRVGNYIISFDYMDNVIKRPTIYTKRTVIRRQNLVNALDNISTEYGNFHLNYAIYMSCSILDDDEVDYIATELSKHMIKHYQADDTGFIYNRIMINNEGIFYKQLFKRKKLKHIKFKWVFINENIYRALMLFIAN